MDPKLIYTRHARTRMARRGISEEAVEAVVRGHDTEYPGHHGERVLIGGVGERRIKIVVGVARNGSPLIITVAGKGELD